MNMQMRDTNPPVFDSHGRSSEGGQLTGEALEAENRVYHGSGGTSQENGSFCFCPAFYDVDTGVVYLSRFADGKIAPMHLLDGLPQEVVTQRTAEGKVKAVKSSVAAGFVRSGRFYTREQAANAIASHKARKIV
jgi:hypothetical protein